MIKAENRLYFLDIYDQALRIMDQIETYHDLTVSALEVYLSLTSNRLNEIMKVLTVITTIMMPLTVITGIYGMNFHFMPELGWRYGYYWALGLMGAVSLIMLGYFRRKKWF